MANDKCSPDQLKKNLELIAKLKEQQKQLAFKKFEQAQMQKIMLAKQQENIAALKKQERINEIIAERKKAEQLAALKKRADIFAMSLQVQVAQKLLTQEQADQLLLAFRNSNEDCSAGSQCFRMHQEDLLYTAWQNMQNLATQDQVKSVIAEKKYYNFKDNSPPNTDLGYKKEVLLPKLNAEVIPFKNKLNDRINNLKVQNDVYIQSIKEQIIAIERMNQYENQLDKRNNKLLNNMDKHFADSFTADRKVWYNLPNLETAEWWTGALKIIFWIILTIFSVFMIYINKKQLLNLKFWIVVLLLVLVPFILPYFTDQLFKLLYNKENVLSVGNLTLILAMGFICFTIYKLFANLNGGNFNVREFKSQAQEIGEKSKDLAEKGIENAKKIKNQIESKAEQNVKSGKDNINKAKQSIDNAVDTVKDALNPKNLEEKAKQIEKKTKETAKELSEKVKSVSDEISDTVKKL